MPSADMINGNDTACGLFLGLWKFLDRMSLYLAEFLSTWYELWKYSNKMAYLRNISTHIKASVEIIHKEKLAIAELIPN